MSTATSRLRRRQRLGNLERGHLRRSLQFESLEERRVLAVTDPFGPETRLNDYIPWAQNNVAVDADAQGNYLAVWDTAHVEGTNNSRDIIAQRYNALGTPVGPQFRVNASPTGSQTDPEIAVAADGSFVVSWTGPDGSQTGVFAQRFAPDGTPLGGTILVNTTTTERQEGSHVGIDADSGEFVIVWHSFGQDGQDWGVFGQRFAADGTPLGSEFQVNTHTNSTQLAGGVAVHSDGSFVVAYSSYNVPGESEYGVYVQRYDANGNKLGGETQINQYETSQQYLPTVEMDAAGNFVIAWASWGQDGSEYGIYARRVAADGTPLGDEFQVNTVTASTQTNPDITVDASGAFVIAWESPDLNSTGVFARRYAADGSPLGDQFQVNTTTLSSQDQPALVFGTAGRLMIAWHDQEGNEQDIHAQFYGDTPALPDLVPVTITAPAGAAPGQTIEVAAALRNQGSAAGPFSVRYYLSTDPVITAADIPLGSVINVDALGAGQSFEHTASLLIPADAPQGDLYVGILVDSGGAVAEGDEANNGVATRGNAPLDVRAAQPLGTEHRLNYSAALQQGEVKLVTAPNGDFVAVWSSEHLEGSSQFYDVFLQRLNPLGTPVGPEVHLNTPLFGSQYYPNIAFGSDGSYVATWTGPDANGAGIFAQRFDASGAPLGDSFQVNTFTNNTQEDSSVAVHPTTGEFVITWTSQNQNNNSEEIYAQRFAADGTKLGGEIHVNTNISSTQYDSSVVYDADGNILVVYSSHIIDSYGIYAQRLSRVDGSKIGDEEPINVYNSSAQWQPQIAINSNGDYLIVWSGYSQDGSSSNSYGIIGQRFAPDGTRVGEQFRINSFLNDDQEQPAVAIDEAGNFVVAWQSRNQDGSGYGVYVQRFHADGTAYGGEFRANAIPTNHQQLPAVALGHDGTLLVAWEGQGNDGNNEIYTRVYRSTPAQPDLVPTYVATPAHGASPGQTINVTSEIRNQGCTAGSFSFRYYLSTDPIITADDTPLTVVVPVTGLTAGDYFRESRQLQIPINVPEGEFYLGILVDSGNEVAESDEANNGVATQFVTPLDVHALPAPLGVDERVNTSTNGDQDQASIAINDAGQGLLVWSGVNRDGWGTREIYLQRINALGTHVGHEQRVNLAWEGEQDQPEAAILDDGSFVVVWRDNDDSGRGIRGQRFAADGSPIGDSFQVNTTTLHDQVEPSIAVNPATGEFVVVWSSNNQDGSNYGVFGQRFAADGTPVGIEFQVNTYTSNHQNEPAVAMHSDGSFVVTWMSNGQDTHNQGIYAQRYAADGGRIGSEFRVNTHTSQTQATPSIGMDGAGNFTIAWHSYLQDGSDYGIFAQRYAANGARLGGEFQVNGTSALQQSHPHVAMDDAGNTFITWSSSQQDGSGFGIVGQRLRPDGTFLGGEIPINSITDGNQQISVATFAPGGRLLVAWEGTGNSEVHLRAFGPGLAQADLVPVDVAAEYSANVDQALPISATIRNQGGQDAGAFRFQYYLSTDPTITADDLPLGAPVEVAGLAAYTSLTDSRTVIAPDVPPGVYYIGVLVDIDGAIAEADEANNAYVPSFDERTVGVAPFPLQGPELQVNSTTNNEQSLPQVGYDAAGNYVVVWQSLNQDGSNMGIYAQRFAADGTEVGPEFLVNTTTANIQADPAIVVAADGSFVIAWHSQGQDGSGLGVYARRYGANGAALGGEFKVNTHTNLDQSSPAIAMDAAGNFTIVWRSQGQDSGGNGGIFAQQYHADGTPRGTEFWVGSNGGPDQYRPHIAMNSSGDFVVVWDDNNDIAARRFLANGTALGSEFRVNSYTSSSQLAPKVAMDEDGNFVITWQSNGQDSSSWGIYAQRYAADGSRQGEEFRVNSTTFSDQLTPDVAMSPDGAFAIAWHSNQQDGSSYGIFAQRYDAAGHPYGGEFRINTFTAQEQSFAAIDLLSVDRMVVAWQSNTQDGNNFGIFAKSMGLTNETGLPNLTPTAFTVPGSISLNQPVGLNYTITNTGPLATRPVTARLWISDDTTFGNGDDLDTGVLVGIPSILHDAGRNTHSGTISFTWPATDPFGTDRRYSFFLEVDSHAVLVESSEADNVRASGEFTLVMPDLVGSLTVPTQINPGETLPITFRARNQGDAPSAPFIAHLWVSDDNIIGNADDIDLLIDVEVPQLAAFSTNFTVNVNYTLPPNLFDTDHNYFIYARYDIANEIVESNETNNTALSNVFIVRQPNLYIDSLFVPSSVAPGETVDVELEVFNLGSRAAAPTTVRLYLSDDNIYGNGDDVDLEVTIDVPALEVYGSPNYSFFSTLTSFDWPEVDPFGTDLNYYVIAVVDPDQEQVETTEQDNVLVSSAILLRVPDLAAGAIDVASTIQPGADLQVLLDVSNLGLEIAKDTIARVYLSDNEIAGDGDDIELPLEIYIPWLYGGESQTIEFFVPWPEVDLFGTDGEYHLVVQLDSEGTLAEGNENNNVSVSSPIAVVNPIDLDIALVGHIGGGSRGIAFSGDTAYELSSAGVRVLNVADPAAIQRLNELVFPVGARSAVHVAGTHLFVVDGRNLRVFDITTPHLPEPVAVVDLEWNESYLSFYRVAFSGEQLFIGDPLAEEVEIWSLATPAQPALLTSYPLRGWAEGIVRDGNQLFVTYYDPIFGRDALEVVNIASLTQPTFVSRRSLNAFTTGVVASDGNMLAVETTADTVLLIDTTDVSLPRIRGMYEVASSSSIEALSLDGSTLYVLTNNGFDEQYVFTVDVGVPSDPAELSSLWLGDAGSGTLVARNDQLYVASDGLYVVDPADRFAPQLLGSYAEPVGVSDVVLHGVVAAVASGSRLQLIDVSQPASPITAGTYQASGPIDRVLSSGQYIVLVTGLNVWFGARLEIVNVADPSQPVLAGEINSFDLPMLLDVVAGDSVLYLLQSNNFGSEGLLTALDISNPAQPQVESQTPVQLNAAPFGPAGLVRRLALVGDTVSVSHTSVYDAEPNNQQQQAIPLGSLDEPVALQGGIDTTGDLNDWYSFTAEAGDFVRVGSRGGTTNYVEIQLYGEGGLFLDSGYYYYGSYFDIEYELPDDGTYYVRVSSGISNPTQRTYGLGISLNEPLPTIVVEQVNGLSLYDVSDPSAPALTSFVNVGTEFPGFAITPTHAYIAQEYPPRLSVWSLADPQQPVKISSAQIDEPGLVSIAGPLALVGTSERLQVVDISDPLLPVGLGSFETGLAVSGIATSGILNYLASDSLYVLSVQPEGVEAPDLVTTRVTAPTSIELGQQATISWSVRNNGRAAAEGTWVDRVYLSTDAALDAGDLVLGSVLRDGPLDPLHVYDGQLQTTLLGVPAGQYYIIVRSDADDAVDEWFVESNNTRVASLPVYVGVPDLTVTSVQAPVVVQKGDLTTVSWIVFNRSDTATTRTWTDQVWLSLDDQFDPQSDLLVGSQSRSGLAARGVYTGAVGLDTANIPEGNYYVFVRTDAADAVPEGAEEGNNLLRGAQRLGIGVPTLVLGEETADSFDFTGQAKYYKIDAAAGENLIVRLNDLNDQGFNELYVKFGAPPTRASYDYRYGTNFAADQSIQIPETQAGSYYILAYADNASDAPASFTISASTVDFEILGISPQTAGNAGEVTISLRAANIPEGALPVLVAPDGTRYEALRVYRDSATSLFPTFNLAGAPLGSYDVRLEAGDAFTEIPDFLQVVTGQGANFVADVVVPSAVRVNQKFTVWVEYTNAGDTDMPAKILYLDSNLDVHMTYPGEPDSGDHIALLAISTTGDAAVLRPGATGRIAIEATAVRGRMEFDLTSLRAEANPIDWESYKEVARRDEIPPQEWDVIWSQVITNVGPTWADYHASILENATRLGRQGVRTHNVADLFGREIDKVVGVGVSAIGGVLRDQQTGELLTGVTVIARKQGGNEQIGTALTDQNGRFSITELSPGTYELFVQGYRFETTPTATVDNETDVLDLELFALPQPTDPIPAEEVISESDPVMTIASDGTPHMVWRRGQDIWHAWYVNGTWQSAAIPGVQGFEPQVQAAGNLLDGSGAGVVVTYRTENAPTATSVTHSDLKYVVGRLNAAGTAYEWSDPELLSGDEVDDESAALAVLPDGQLAVVWQKRNSSITDDYDLYYQVLTLESNDFQFGQSPAMAVAAALGELIYGRSSATESFEISYTQKSPPFKVPHSVPFLSGEYGEELQIKGSGQKSCSGASVTVDVTGKVKAGMVSASGGGGGGFNWKVEGQDECSDGYYVFNGGSAQATVGVDAEIPAFFWTVGIAKLELGSLISGSTSAQGTWDPGSFPGWPTGGQLQVTLAAGPYGKATLSIPWLGEAEGKIGGQGGLQGTADMATGNAQWQVLVKLFAEATVAGIGVGWNKTWTAPNGSVVAGEELTYTLSPSLGTANVYAGMSVLADVSQSLTNDGNPSLARGPAGELYVGATRDSATPNLWVGNEVIVTPWTGSDWGAPSVIPGSRGFNSDVELIYDDAGTLHAVWTMADSSGLTAASDVNDALARMADSRLVHASFDGVNWTAPQVIGDVLGTVERGISLGETADGKIIATWLTGDELGESLHASILTGSTWSEPVVVTTADITTTPTLGVVGGETTIVWSQEVGTGATPIQRLVQSKLNLATGTWSAPEFLVLAADLPDGDPTPTPAYYAWSPSAPPDGVTQTTVAYFFDEATLPAGISPENAAQALRDAAAVWSGVTGTLQLVEAPSAEAADIYLSFADMTACGGVDAGILACSEYAVSAGSSGSYANGAVLHRFVSNSDAGENLQRITFVNDWNWYVDASSAVPAGQFDLMSVALHEFGHLLGLTGHSISPDSPLYPTVSSGTARRSLTAADSAAILYLYAGIGAPPAGSLVNPFADQQDFLEALNDPGAVPDDCVDEEEDCCDDEDPDPDDDDEDDEDDDDSDGVQSFDPNDKVGPKGAGALNYVLPGNLMPFSIFYENDPEQASAPAQIVRVEDQLSEHWDWTTFELGDINLFGDYVIDVPAGLSHYETIVDLRPEGLPILVRVTAGIDSQTGMAQWLFESLDPDTLAAPENPLIGFLAVNNKELHNGEGHFEYFIRPKAGLPSGTQITNQAFNYFDDNEPVPTPITLHTIDNGAPISLVQTLAPLSPDEPLLVSWSGQDDAGGAGIGSFTIYVSDNGGPWQVWLVNTMATSSLFTGTPGHHYQFRSVATDLVGHVEADPGTPEAETTIDFTELRVDAVEVGTSTVEIHFKRPIRTDLLNLYDGQSASYGAADIQLVGQSVGPVNGSLLITNGGRTLTFVKTGGPLAADTYQLIVRSGDDGVRDLDGNLLDGNGDDVAGGDFQTEFVVEPTSARTVSLPDFARGPGQAVNLPATATGIPLSIDNGDGVLSIDFELHYDPALLSVTGMQRGSGLPSDWAVAVNLSVPGRVVGTAYGATPLSAGQHTFALLQASVPSTAPYTVASTLKLADVAINDGAILARSDEAVQVVAYFGDATGNHAYSGLDASQIARVAVGLDSGFTAYRLKDPTIIADVTGNNALSALDASYVARKSVQLAQPEIPDLGTLAPLIQTGPDPTIEVGSRVALPSSQTAVPLTVTDTAAGLQATDLRLAFHSDYLTIVDVRPKGLAANWSVVWRFDAASGELTLSAWGLEPIAGGTGDILEVVFDVAGAAPRGWSTPLSLDGDLNEDLLTLTAIDGMLIVNPEDNVAPIANGQSHNVAEDTSIPMTLTGDDGNTAVQTLTFTVVQGPQHGTISGFNPATGTLTYTPHANYHGTDSFTFTVTDDATLGGGALTSAPATVTINLSAVNDRPSALSQQISMQQGVLRPIQLTGDDGDPEVVQTLTYVITQQPLHGTLHNFNPATGTLVYEADPGYTGSDSFSFTVIDDATAGGPALTSFTNSISITVHNAASSWRNPVNSFDVDNDNQVTPLDALLIINYLNIVGSGLVPQSPAVPPPFYDVDGDFYVTPLDPLLVVNHLNALLGGEPPAELPPEGEPLGDLLGAALASGAANQSQQSRTDLVEPDDFIGPLLLELDAPEEPDWCEPLTPVDPLALADYFRLLGDDEEEADDGLAALLEGFADD